MHHVERPEVEAQVRADEEARIEAEVSDRQAAEARAKAAQDWIAPLLARPGETGAKVTARLPRPSA